MSESWTQVTSEPLSWPPATDEEVEDALLFGKWHRRFITSKVLRATIEKEAHRGNPPAETWYWRFPDIPYG